MDPASSSNTTERILALFDRLDALYGELKPLEDEYRAWAREFQATGVPHDRREFAARIRHIDDLKDQVATVRAALKALGGGR